MPRLTLTSLVGTCAVGGCGEKRGSDDHMIQVGIPGLLISAPISIQRADFIGPEKLLTKV